VGQPDPFRSASRTAGLDLDDLRPSLETRGEPMHWVVYNDMATLDWLVNQDCVEVHPWVSRIDMPEFPDYVLFNLHPSPRPPSARSFSWLA
jgi:DNA primase